MLTANKKVFIFAAIGVAVFFLIVNIPFTPIHGGDSNWYISIAEGHISEVIQPFSGRLFYPLLAGGINSLLPLGVVQSFLFLAIISLFGFLIVNFSILKKKVESVIFISALFISPYIFSIFREYFLSDIFYIFLLALFFLFLSLGKDWAALLTLFFLFLTRESTILLGFLFLLTSFWKPKKFLSLAIVIVIIVSFFVVSQASSIGLPNVHNLTGFSYLILKLPYNFLNNVLGIIPWSNTLPHCNPIFSFNLPSLSFLGSIHSIGICDFNALFPLSTLVVLISTFGIMPVVVFSLFRKWKIILKETPLWLVLAVIFGLTSYFISIIATTGVQRLAGYGWPLFLLAAPILFYKYFQFNKKLIIKLSLSQIFVAWLPFVIRGLLGDTIVSAIVIIFIIGFVYFYIYRVIKNQKVNFALEETEVYNQISNER